MKIDEKAKEEVLQALEKMSPDMRHETMHRALLKYGDSIRCEECGKPILFDIGPEASAVIGYDIEGHNGENYGVLVTLCHSCAEDRGVI